MRRRSLQRISQICVDALRKMAHCAAIGLSCQSGLRHGVRGLSLGCHCNHIFPRKQDARAGCDVKRTRTCSKLGIMTQYHQRALAIGCFL